MFFNRDADRRAREENHRSSKFFKRPIAVRDAKTGDIIDRLVLQLAARATVKNRVAKGNIFGSIEGFEYRWLGRQRDYRRAHRCR